ncbi:MAG TPA: magnesium-translocating P-type ATPase, partial [Kofleriaceae bacterium]|nr:magnesium-translocating P-type ATPase [Kofleriaceae bacterium]
MKEYWTHTPEEVAHALGTGLGGLSSVEAERRQGRFGPNEIRRRATSTRLHMLWRQVRSPLVLLLVFAAIASGVSGEWADATIVVAILVASVGIGYRREYHAETAIKALLERVQMMARVIRDGKETSVPVHDLVPGDVFTLAAGSLVPADGLVIEAAELHVDDAVLTGESFPVAKRVGAAPADATLRQRKGCVQLGTNVRSGSARVLVVETGPRTAIGAIADRLIARAPETELERGLRRFGMMLLVAMLVMIVVVFSVHMFMGSPAIDTLLFSIALAVGLSPELLPAILSFNLSRAAQTLAAEGVLVRRLASIENLGSMNVLCTDKTGTLTEGVVRVDGAFDATGQPSEQVMDLAVLNASLQAGLPNPIDAALLDTGKIDRAGVRKLGEVPYDFTRKRLSVIVERAGTIEIVAKGAFSHILEVCRVDDARRAELSRRYDAWSSEGTRVIAVATRTLEKKPQYDATDEAELELVGFVTFLDRPKADAVNAVNSLRELGVRVKMITGDSRLVAKHVASQVGIPDAKVLIGEELHDLTDIALLHAADTTDVFAEVDPNQKERILRALRRGGAVVGFFGDGVNDAPAMHAADVSISVESAVDVAKSTADMVLTRRDLDVIRQGVTQGRHTFANTLKYVLTTTSANLGNMISMAVASLVLPFLPLTAGQVLLNNFLSDIPAVGIANDRVDRELVEKPRRWEIGFIGRFMLEFGLLSSVFDGMTFVVLVLGFHSSAETFRTGWFIESLFTELVIALVVRTRRRAWSSRPGSVLLWTTVAVAVLTFAIPYLPYIHVLGFVRLPATIMFVIV